MINELTILKDTINLLDQYKVYLGYVTAELEPFSSQQKPDLIVPILGENQVLFVEYKIAPSTEFKNSFWIGFDEKKAFVEESSEPEVIYAFATNIKLGEKIKNDLEANNILVFDESKDAETLSNIIKAWYNENK